MNTGFNFISHRGNGHPLEIGMNSFHDHRKGSHIPAQKKNPFHHHHGHREEDFLLQFSLPAKAEDDTVAARNTPTPKIHIGRSGSPSRATKLRLQSLHFLVTKCSNMFSGIGPWTWTIM
ncbi:hypothetical protein POPTR_008G076001v4 [Populus trichocarpa]|uniref:Uncharacterized protein n=2 Tax=Populus trichocarpa TaxID=3694 RepID=A0ACC0SK85_POPTR|nr:hypothetical protein BDE02_08G068400 [Populus trichocarpa]KAI9389676.1 hypothetical protein POPTR_008G076001v4 [Populus trichocarpa]